MCVVVLPQSRKQTTFTRTVNSDLDEASDGGSPAPKKKRKLQDSDGKSDAHVAASGSDGDTTAAQSGTKSKREIRPAVAEPSAKALQLSCHTHAQTCSFVTRSC